MIDEARGRPNSMRITIYHNPACGTSRNALALIRHFGIEPRIVEYVRNPPSRTELSAILVKAGLSPRQAVRKKETIFAELDLETAGDETLLDAMVAHPILINRPLVVAGDAAALCRPSDVVLDLLPPMAVADALKEEGAPILKDARIDANDAGLIAALTEAKLPTDDLGEPGRTFYAYRSLAGATLGYGGYELYGADAFLRSVVVAPKVRGRRIGRNLVPLLLYRAYRQGARTAWLLTVTAADFFAKIAFHRRPRTEAPAAILETREAKSLCPVSAVLLSKTIGF